MKLLLSVIKNDIKIIFRDSMLYIMFFLPVIFILLFRFLVPLVTEYIYDGLPDYYWLIVAALTCISASTPSFMIGFILLDERDEHVHVLQKILPLPPDFILKSRIVFMVFSSFIFSVLMLHFNGLITIPIFYNISISVLFSLIPPVLTFLIVSIAKNKIEAATLYKGMSMVLFIPVAAFFIREEWRPLFGIVPFYYTFNSFNKLGEFWPFILNFLAGITTHFLFIIILYRIFKRKVV